MWFDITIYGAVKTGKDSFEPEVGIREMDQWSVGPPQPTRREAQVIADTKALELKKALDNILKDHIHLLGWKKAKP